MDIPEMRAAAEAIARSAIAAVAPEKLIRNVLRADDARCHVGDLTFDFDRFSRILVVGTGKATASMARTVEDILQDRIADGVVVVPDGLGRQLRRIRVFEASHPIPDERGMAGARSILSLIRQNARPDALVLCLISGGGSALLPLPVDGISLADKQQVTRLLLECGANISEVNAVRKHLSQIKGGQLARAASPAHVVSLILSDVVNDPVDTIASGPTAPDPTTFSDVVAILRKYQIWDRVPKSVHQILTKGVGGEIPDTPKADDTSFLTVTNVIVGNNRIAVQAAAKQALAIGFHPLILTSCISGEAREVGTVFASIAKEAECFQHPVGAPACLLAGGETTVTIRGNGKGGRNQELALSAAIAITGTEKIVIAGIGTDGADGPTDAAGAIVDSTSVGRALAEGLDPVRCLDSNDSYSLHAKTGDLLVTGRTGTNVMDLLIGLVG